MVVDYVCFLVEDFIKIMLMLQLLILSCKIMKLR